ncbi:lipopolysaccharide heptosyltransferase I [Usitatibacter palustris]|uniref:Lipopolysaccharide heptosyltransferase 1 n=1 Tax=Usitatibacter palustris TaxID=2732487 RepID=A0A6M4H1Q1_9PROT|nr:lipopolysaccharide heptosyltransferase I [Usitatibacter palustris]QJR13275.1 Lipopolysaccharide heptosyltransferase 1 [Usitatibacter palustris]
MTVPRVLFVKLSSLGDVIHHMPAVTDLRARRPELQIHWAVEEAYADLVRLHPAVDQVIPVGLRRAKGAPFASSTWRSLRETREALRRERYDYVVDTQGLTKSALVAANAHGIRFGFDRASARERFAARFYDQGIKVARKQHAVERNRQLVANVFGYEPEGEASYGLVAPEEPPAWAPEGPYFVALHAASRANKRWPDALWIDLAARLWDEGGLVGVYPGGNPAEREQAARLAAASPQGVAAPEMSLVEAAALLRAADSVVGVDTGLTHLAVALESPAVAGIYCATDPTLTGLHGWEYAKSLGGVQKPPTVDEVMAALGFAAPPEFDDVPTDATPS